MPMTLCSPGAVHLIVGAILTCVCASDEAECDFAWGASAHLLQTDRTIRRAGAHELASVAARSALVGSDQEQGALPLRWLHVQKCASSFGNTLLHVRGACRDVPEDFMWMGFWDEEVEEFDCPGLTLTGFGGHSSVATHWDKFKGHVATTLRRPSQRVLSAFYYAQELDEVLAKNFTTAPEFAVANQGLLTKLLTQEGWFAWGYEGESVTEADALLAAQRIQEGFVFVGMVEEWDLSICLFNAMFNMDCMALQFADTTATIGVRNASIDNSTGDYDESVLEGFWDKYDAVPYKSGQEFFTRGLEDYGVSDASCSKCWARAGLLSQ